MNADNIGGMPQPDVSILIVTWNSSADIVQCIQSVLDQSRLRTYEIILVDNQSADDTVALVTAKFSQVRILQSPGNVGFSPAMNIALQHTTGRFYLWLNPDARLQNDVLDKLCSALEEELAAGAAAPAISDDSGHRCAFAARYFPTLAGSSIRHFGLAWVVESLLPVGNRWSPGLATTRRRVECLTGAALMVRADVARTLGMLDVTLPMYFEDLDYCARLSELGWKLLFAPEAQITHAGAQSAGRSTQRSLLLAMEDGHAPWLYFAIHRSRLAAEGFRSIVFFASVLRLVLVTMVSTAFLLARRTTPVALGFAAVRAQSLIWWSCQTPFSFCKRVSAHFEATHPQLSRSL